MKIVFTGGGTGGHIYPALALAGALRAADDAIGMLFLGNEDGLEASIVPQAGYTLRYVPSRALGRRDPLGVVRTIVENGWGALVAGRELARFAPDAVIATGGYVCFPVVLAARVLRLLRIIDPAIALLEPNAQPGLTARLAGPLVDEVWAAYASSQSYFGAKVQVTGTPVRPELRRPARPWTARRQLGLDPERRTIVVMGGSQGARSINEAVTALVTRRTLPESWQVLHVCGRRDYEYMLAEQRERSPGNAVTLVPYLEDPSSAYAAADVVIARAGASTLAELAATATPSILIPYPHATDDHQRKNAAVFVEAGAARAIDDADLNGDALWWALLELFESGRLGAMRSAAATLAPGDAAQAIVERVGVLTGRG